MDGLNQKTSTNGCGACGGFWRWFKPPHHNFFKNECNVHDSLYNIGGNSIDRLVADLILLNNMIKKVSLYFYKRKPISRYWYYLLCISYYIAVRIVGFTLFNYKNLHKMKLLIFLNKFYYKYYGNRNAIGDVNSNAVSRVMAAKILIAGILSIPVYSYLNDIEKKDVNYFTCYCIAYIIMIPIVVALNSIYKNLFKRTFKEIVVATIIPLGVISWLLGGITETTIKDEKK